MTELKHIDELVQGAGLQNLGSFLCNLVTMFDQELGALKCAAEENAAVNHRCPTCGEAIVRGELVDFFLQVPPFETQKPYFVIHWECPSCAEHLSAHIVLVDVERDHSRRYKMTDATRAISETLLCKLTDDELITLNTIAILDTDPRTTMCWPKARALFTELRHGVPAMHDGVKDAVYLALLQRGL